MRFIKKNGRVTKARNSVDPATSPIRWGESVFKKYRGCAGKGGATTNYVIPEWMFKRELNEYKEGVLDA